MGKHHGKYGHIARILLHAHKNDNLSFTDRHVIIKRFAFRGNYSQLRHEGWYVPRRGIWRVKCFWQLRSTAFFAHPIWDDKPAIDRKTNNVITARVSYLITLNIWYLCNVKRKRHIKLTYCWDLISLHSQIRVKWLYVYYSQREMWLPNSFPNKAVSLGNTRQILNEKKGRVMSVKSHSSLTPTSHSWSSMIPNTF